MAGEIMNTWGEGGKGYRGGKGQRGTRGREGSEEGGDWGKLIEARGET